MLLLFSVDGSGSLEARKSLSLLAVPMEGAIVAVAAAFIRIAATARFAVDTAIGALAWSGVFVAITSMLAICRGQPR